MDTETPRDLTSTSSRLRQTETWIFDLDNTLYPASCRLFDQVDRNITLFIMAELDLEWDDAYRIQKSYFREHGTSMNGLMKLHDVDPEQFLAFVHDIDLSPVDPNPALDEALAALPGRKLIFTNGSVEHAHRVSTKLGVRDHFDVIFDIVASDYRPKPEPAVYHKLSEQHGVRPQHTVMVEDMARNLKPAADMGMTCVWVRTETTWGQEGSDGDHVHHVVDDLTAWLVNVVAG